MLAEWLILNFIFITPYSCSQLEQTLRNNMQDRNTCNSSCWSSVCSSLSPLFLIPLLVSFGHFLLFLLTETLADLTELSATQKCYVCDLITISLFVQLFVQFVQGRHRALLHSSWKTGRVRRLIPCPQRPICAYRILFVFVDGLTHWSLTGSTMTDEDTFMGFSDGLSQSGIVNQ